MWLGFQLVAAAWVCFWTWMWPCKKCELMKNWLDNFQAPKTELVSYDCWNNSQKKKERNRYWCQKDGFAFNKRAVILIFRDTVFIL